MIRRRKRIWLLLWVAGIIFPMAALSRISPWFHWAFNTIFAPNWVHVVMHTLLFSGLVLFLLAAFGLRPGRRAAVLALLAILLIAAVQEGFQALDLGYFPFGGSFYDLKVDLVGGSIGYGLAVVFRRYHRAANSSTGVNP